MLFKTPTGRTKNVPIHKYRVDWDAPQGSKFSKEVLDFLRPYWRNDVVLSELPVCGTRLRYDFCNLNRRIILETDGSGHFDPNSFWNRGSKAVWLSQIKRDNLKDDMAALNGFQMVRIEPQDLPLSRAFFKTKFDIEL